MKTSGAFRPKKSLGQNFLINQGIIHRIVSSCELSPEETVLEIGPGKGAITRALCEHVKDIIAIEKDDVLAEQLRIDLDGTNADIVHADILRYPFAKLPNDIKIIGNLPYNIATPIIEKVIGHRHKFNSFYMTVQSEYGQRLAAKANTKKYGSLSCFVQYFGEVKILFKIGNSAFKPAPKVQSCFLKFDLSKTPKYKALDEKKLFAIIRTCFGQRRKTVINSLSGIMRKEKAGELLQVLGLNPKLRAENITLEQYVGLSDLATKEERRGEKVFI